VPAAGIVTITIEPGTDDTGTGQIVVESHFPADTGEDEGLRSRRSFTLFPTDN
jgi:hypothetical protein